jgi:hypothetical protein
VSEGGFGEDCLSFAPRCLLSLQTVFAKRVPQPPSLASSAGNFCRGLIATKTMNPGRLFFGSFLLAKQKKGTSRRATPGLVDESPRANTCGANRFAHCALRARTVVSIYDANALFRDFVSSYSPAKSFVFGFATSLNSSK